MRRRSCKQAGEYNLFVKSITPALHACYPSTPGWLILNGAGGAVMTLQMPTMTWVCCAGEFLGDDLVGMNWGQLMLLDTELDVMGGTHITLGLDRATELSRERLIRAIRVISASASGAHGIALTITRAHFQFVSTLGTWHKKSVNRF